MNLAERETNARLANARFAKECVDRRFDLALLVILSFRNVHAEKSGKHVEYAV